MFVNFLINYLFLLLFIFYFYRIGHILSKILIFKNINVSVCIILGLGFFISIINIFYTLGLRDFKILLALLFLHILIIFLKNFRSIINFSWNIKLLFILILSLLVCLSSFKNKFVSHDDLIGYFDVYSSIINNNFNFSPDFNLRNQNSGFGYNFIQSIFIFFGNYTSLYFFDQSFGTILILIFVFEKFKNNNINYFFIFFIFLSTLIISETSQPKVIIFALALIILFELKKFYINPLNLNIIISLIFISYNLRYNFLISFVTILFFNIFFLNFLKKKIEFRKNFKIIVYLFSIFLLPDFINKYFIFKSFSPILFTSHYSIFENAYYKRIEFLDSKSIYSLYFWTSVFFKKHFLFIIIIFTILLKIKKFPFYILLLSSYLLSIILISFPLSPDAYNIRRYLMPTENALIIFLVLEIIFYFNFTKKLNNIRPILILAFIIITLNISFMSIKVHYLYELYKVKIVNLVIIFFDKDNNNSYFYNKKIPNNIESSIYLNEIEYCLKNFTAKKKILIIANYGYLINNKNIKKMEPGLGYSTSKDMYPFLQTFNDKHFFFKNNYEGIIIEKDLIFSDKFVNKILKELPKAWITSNILDTKILPFHNKYDNVNYLSWIDFLSFLKEYIDTYNFKNNCNTKNFISIKF
jgi:hypothetical protein